MKFPNAEKGVRKIFGAEIISLISAILLGVATVIAIVMSKTMNLNSGGAAASGIAMLAIFSAGSIMLIVGGIMELVGYFQASKDEDGFKKAFYCIIISLIFSFIGGFFSGSAIGWVGAALKVVSQVMQLAAFIFAINGLMNLAANCNRQDMVQKGSTILKLLVCTYIFSFIMIILTSIFTSYAVNRTLAIIFTVVSLILSIVQYVLYLSYLNRSKKMLAEN